METVRVPENLPNSVFVAVWHKLYAIFGERIEQENLDLMDSILQDVVSEVENQPERINE